MQVRGNGPEWVAVDRAIEAGQLTKLPVMVDFGAFLDERPFQELVLEKMRPGDTYTHMFYEPVPIVDQDGKLLPYLSKARKRGVQFDLGHGRDSFLWRQAIPAVRQGWLPNARRPNGLIQSQGQSTMMDVGKGGRQTVVPPSTGTDWLLVIEAE